MIKTKHNYNKFSLFSTIYFKENININIKSLKKEVSIVF
jgi:hypothetical protein